MPLLVVDQLVCSYILYLIVSCLL